MRMRLPATINALVLMLAAAPALAQQGPRALSAGDVQRAESEHAKVVEQFGGPADPKLTAYVASVARRISPSTNVVNAPEAYRVTVLNSPVRNAFAVPGGYVYVTRELLSLMNSEDELAFVLGHEMGHVAARHGQKRQTRSTLGAIGAAIAQAITGSDIVGQVAGQVGKGLLAGYSRGQENESDTLGLRYSLTARYDPYAAPRILSALGAAESLDARVAGRQSAETPSWTRTHPLSAERVQRTTALARQAQPSGPSAESRDRLFAAIDGMSVGDDPRQGMVEGRRFKHPQQRFQFTAPSGYTIDNGANAVTVAGSGGQATFGAGRLTGSVDGYLNGVFRALSAGMTPPPAQTTTINGIPAAYATTRAQTSSGQLDVTVVAYRWSGDRAYHFITLTPAGRGLGPFRDMIGSLAPLSAQEAAAIRPRVIRIVTVARGDTPRSLAVRMAYPDYQLERFLVLNGLDANSRLTPGTKVKVVAFAP